MAEQQPERSGLAQVITLPAFGDLPVPSAIHPETDSIIEHTCQWALATGLASENEVARLRRGGIMHAGPRLVPGASVDAACLVCDWTVWLIVLDDKFDDEGSELGTQPELARAAIADVIRAFRGQADEVAASVPQMAGVNAAAADLGLRFQAQSPSSAWLARFRHHAEDHIRSKVDETEHRAKTSGPEDLAAAGVLDVPSYITLRRITSAARPYADLVEMAAQAAIAQRVQDSPAWEQMLDAAADVWLGIQDICSAAKEVAAGDDLNLARVMAPGAHALQEGVDSAYEWVCERSGDLADQRAELEGLPRRLGLDDEAGTAMTEYLKALGYLLGGHRTWNRHKNPRYPQVVPSSSST